MDSTTAITWKGDNVSTIQRTETKENIFTVQRTKTKEIEMGSGIVTCYCKVPNEHIPFSKGDNYLLSPYTVIQIKINYCLKNIIVVFIHFIGRFKVF